jgi:hypothetical protein
MFEKKLSAMTLPQRVLITAFLLIMGVGYLASVFTIYISHKEADGKPALSMNDIIITYYGDRETTLLATKSLGTMRQYYDSAADLDTVLGWIDAGADRIGYEKNVAPIFKKSCIECHSVRGSESHTPLTDYDEVKEYVTVSTGVEVVRLAGLSHTHLISHGVMFFILSLIFLATAVKDRYKIILITVAFIAVVGDVLSWWLAKLSPLFSYFSVMFGAFLGIAFIFFFFVPLYELWGKGEK